MFRRFPLFLFALLVTAAVEAIGSEMCGTLFLKLETGNYRAATASEIEAHHNRSCSTTCEEARAIYSNCIISLMPDGKVESTKRKAIWGKCQRAACNPTFFDNLRY